MMGDGNLKYFISCDWGTSNFRLRLVETGTLHVLASHKTDQGIKTLNEKFRNTPNGNREVFFTEYLAGQLKKLPDGHQRHPVVLSGMASSTIGMRELDYTAFPILANGESLYVEKIVFDSNQTILLTSGVKSSTGMVRGEEIQAIGLEEYVRPHGTGILILPGTHSKHIGYGGGVFTTLQTFLTGELFDVLVTHSILSLSVQPNKWNDTAQKSFQEGLQRGLNGAMTANLFLVRAKDVLMRQKKADNYFFLSGMLIGDELSYLKNLDSKLFLAACDPIFSLYKNAFTSIFSGQRLVLFDGHMLEMGLLKGQRKILLQHAN